MHKEINLNKLVNNSYEIFISQYENNNFLSYLQLSRKDFNYIYGIWLIYLIHLTTRIGYSKTFNRKIYPALSSTYYTNLNYSLQQDYYFKLYYLRILGVNKSYNIKYIENEVERRTKNNKFIDNFKINTNKNKLLVDSLYISLMGVINHLSSNYYELIYTDEKINFLFESIIQAIPYVMIDDNFAKLKSSLKEEKLSKINYCKKIEYGENLRSCILLSLGHNIITKQHGLQENLIHYNPFIFYKNKAKIPYFYFNTFLNKAEDLKKNKRFIPMNLILKALLEITNIKNLVNNILAIFKRPTIVIFTVDVTPGQIPIGHEELYINLWHDLNKLTLNVSENFNVIVRPHIMSIYLRSDNLKKLDYIKNVKVDYEKKYRFKFNDLIILPYFSTAILERSLGNGEPLMYWPEYLLTAKLNKTGKDYISSSNINTNIYNNLEELTKRIYSYKFFNIRNIFKLIIFKIKTILYTLII